MARLLLVDVLSNDIRNTVKEVECNELEDYYRHLHCDCFDIANRKVGNSRYDIFVDDIGLFAEDPLVSAVRITDDAGYEPMLVGNLIFANHDSEGNTTDLTNEDIVNIKEHIIVAARSDSEGNMKLQAVVELDY